MTEVSSSLPAHGPTPRPSGLPHTPSVTIPSANVKNQFLGLDAFSPVNQNGSFEFDRVIRSGEVNKRSRKTKSWKRFYLVLRPNVLSVYKSRSEEKLLKQMELTDVTAVAVLKDPKGRRSFMFGVFSPARNFHFQASNDEDARAWVDLIKHEARVDEEESTAFGSPPAAGSKERSMEQYIFSGDEGASHLDRDISSSPEPMDFPSSYTTTRDGVRVPVLRTSSAGHNDLDYSGAEQGSFSDYSDGGPARVRKSIQLGAQTPTATTPAAAAPPTPLETQQNNRNAVTANSAHDATATTTNTTAAMAPRPGVGRNVSGASNVAAVDDERVVFQGYLLCLKSKGGVRQWKRLWTVLRPKNLTFYKNEDEYAAQLILPLSSLLSAVEIDPVSRTKAHCMQIIAEEKSYRFCASSEEVLARWLGAVKSQLAKRKEKKAVAATAPATAPATATATATAAAAATAAAPATTVVAPGQA